MPRPKVSDEHRRRCAQACDNCKRRKEKCDGLKPCNLCRRRGREPECYYTDGPVRTTRTTHLRKKSVELRDNTGNSSDAEIAIESLLNLSGSRSGPKTPHPDDSHSGQGFHAPVPKFARLLKDGKGKFLYIGDSANLSFLQNIRRLVKTSIGECQFTTDHLRHALVESSPLERLKGFGPLSIHQVPKPVLEEAQEFVQQYFIATSGILDLFDPLDVMRHLPAWVNDASAEEEFSSSMFYLILAIGAQVRPTEGGEELAESYFNCGRQLVVSSFMDDPSVLTIQSYALITMYMLIVCRRNGAFMNLGIAVRAAYALGLHRSDISALFYAREREARDRVWKTLRVLDVCLSASLGRPLATSELDVGHVSWSQNSRDYDGTKIRGLSFSAMLRICFIFERILNEVYCRREVTAQLVESISHQYRDWTFELPGTLKTDGLAENDDSPNATMQQTVGISHLKGAYYWSIILLTRPFLVFMVSSHLKRTGQQSGEDPSLRSPVITFADACVDSAIRSMEIASDLVRIPGIPKRLPLMWNSVFLSALVYGVGCFGDFDQSFPLASGLDQAVAILGYFAKYDASARRCLQIVQYLRDAATKYIERRDRDRLERRRQDVSHMFGHVLGGSAPVPGFQTPHGAPLTPADPLEDNVIVEGQDYAGQGPQVDGSVGRIRTYLQRAEDDLRNGPTITTFGHLAGPNPPPFQTYEQYADLHPTPADTTDNIMSPASSGIPSIPSYAEEFPLFSLLSDFDSMDSDQYLLGPG